MDKKTLFGSGGVKAIASFSAKVTASIAAAKGAAALKQTNLHINSLAKTNQHSKIDLHD